MRNVILALPIALIASASAASESGIEGKWKRNDGNAIVSIAPCGAKVCATNVWIADTSGGEEVGDKLVMSLQPKATGKFEGSAYDVKRKLSYSIVVTRSKAGLTTRGCFLASMLCKNVSWTAAK